MAATGASRAAGARDIASAQARVLRWFDEHARPFPWREHRDPYRTLVAEVMLQQTQTGRVATAYPEFLKRFPSVERLAHAPAMEVIQAWRGMGYNRRAVDLQRAAQAIAHTGEFPSAPSALRKLPGVAEYTANAVACFAFDAQVPVVDTNVRRVLARVAHGKDGADVDLARLRSTASTWLPVGEAYRWNQALMDVGAMICRPERPLCPQCPLKQTCRFRAAGRHRVARQEKGTKSEPFEGSRRQKRGGIVDALRVAAEKGVTLSALSKAVHPGGDDRSLTWLVELLEDLERDGLVTLSDAARRASPRGVVRLPA